MAFTLAGRNGEVIASVAVDSDALKCSASRSFSGVHESLRPKAIPGAPGYADDGTDRSCGPGGFFPHTGLAKRSIEGAAIEPVPFARVRRTIIGSCHYIIRWTVPCRSPSMKCTGRVVNCRHPGISFPNAGLASWLSFLAEGNISPNYIG